MDAKFAISSGSLIVQEIDIAKLCEIQHKLILSGNSNESTIDCIRRSWYNIFVRKIGTFIRMIPNTKYFYGILPSRVDSKKADHLAPDSNTLLASLFLRIAVLRNGFEESFPDAESVPLEDIARRVQLISTNTSATIYPPSNDGVAINNGVSEVSQKTALRFEYYVSNQCADVGAQNIQNAFEHSCLYKYVKNEFESFLAADALDSLLYIDNALIEEYVALIPTYMLAAPGVSPIQFNVDLIVPPTTEASTSLSSSKSTSSSTTVNAQETFESDVFTYFEKEIMRRTGCFKVGKYCDVSHVAVH